MIYGQVTQAGQVIRRATWYDPKMSLEMALKNLELWVVNEQFNDNGKGECQLRVAFDEKTLTNPKTKFASM